MARLVSLAFVLVLFAAPVQAQVANSNAPNPWDVSADEKSSPSFDIVEEARGAGGVSKGSVIIAGTEVSPNTMIGFGLFGERAERPDHARSINRDYSLPKTRKAAVGFALRF